MNVLDQAVSGDQPSFSEIISMENILKTQQTANLVHSSQDIPISVEMWFLITFCIV